MKINRGREANAASEDRTDGVSFTGIVWGDSVLSGVPGVLVNTVFFGPGGRTYWHTHDNGQVLLVTEGRGRVQTRDGDGDFVTAGDVIFFHPGEEHWHGAVGDSFLVHTAISLGQTNWLDEVSDDDYRAAIGS